MPVKLHVARPSESHPWESRSPSV